MKLNLCVILSFFVCCFTLLVSGSSESESDQCKNVNQSPSAHFEALSKYFKDLEDRNRELEKSHEELKEQFKILT